MERAELPPTNKAAPKCNHGRATESSGGLLHARGWPFCNKRQDDKLQPDESARRRADDDVGCPHLASSDMMMFVP